MPPIVTAGAVNSVPVCVEDPSTSGVLGKPNPTAYSTMVSFGFAGIERPRYRSSGPTSVLPSACVAATYFPPNSRNDGELVRAFTLNGALVLEPFVTFTSSKPTLESSGVSTLI